MKQTHRLALVALATLATAGISLVLSSPGAFARGGAGQSHGQSGTHDRSSFSRIFPGVNPDRLTTSDIPETCFFDNWYHGNEFAYAPNAAMGSGNFPDTFVSYWPATFILPEGSTMFLKGEFPRARYMAIDPYGGGGSLGAFEDASIEPDPGSTNPFLPGAKRNASRRRWTLRVLDTPPPPPAQQEPNTIYAGPPPGVVQEFAEIRYRVYVPDRGEDITGGVGLPKMELKLADGKILKGREACERVNPVTEGKIFERALPPQVYDDLVHRVSLDPVCAPALRPTRWERFFNAAYSLLGLYMLTQPNGAAKRAMVPFAGATGFEGTLSNRYVLGTVCIQPGEVAVTRVKAPTTPKTRNGQPIMGTGQLRFFSVCNYELPREAEVALTPEKWPRSNRQIMCINDEFMAPDADGFVTIVTSRPEDRPWNATNACGASWMATPDESFGGPVSFLTFRHLLPDPSFTQSAHAVVVPGTESAVMGPYLPTTEFMSTADFEAGGCNVMADAPPDIPRPLNGASEQVIQPSTTDPVITAVPPFFFP